MYYCKHQYCLVVRGNRKNSEQLNVNIITSFLNALFVLWFNFTHTLPKKQDIKMYSTSLTVTWQALQRRRRYAVEQQTNVRYAGRAAGRVLYWHVRVAIPAVTRIDVPFQKTEVFGVLKYLHFQLNTSTCLWAIRFCLTPNIVLRKVVDFLIRNMFQAHHLIG